MAIMTDPDLIAKYYARRYSHETFVADRTVINMIDRKGCTMSWGIEFNATTKAKAKDVVADYVNNTVLPTNVGDLIASLIDMLALPDDPTIAAKTIINVKSHGHVGKGSHAPNLHIDVRTATLDRT